MARRPKYEEPMRTVTVKLREADVEWLDARATERDTDRSAVLRQVLDRFRTVTRPAGPPADPDPERRGRQQVTPRPKGGTR